MVFSKETSTSDLRETKSSRFITHTALLLTSPRLDWDQSLVVSWDFFLYNPRILKASALPFSVPRSSSLSAHETKEGRGQKSKGLVKSVSPFFLVEKTF